MIDLDTALNVIAGIIRDREGWARTGSATADARNDGELAGLYIALAALTGNPHPDEDGGRRAFALLNSQ
ncbi:hypothetical protein [Streptomyces sp. bgisy153]|uniref:hypothetical protein n=1 Tax=Streptomyces sp. bgisy153 TaxID=3413793 RepID=UPI003D71EA76